LFKVLSHSTFECLLTGKPGFGQTNITSTDERFSRVLSKLLTGKVLSRKYYLVILEFTLDIKKKKCKKYPCATKNIVI